MNILFWGSPDFSVPALEALIGSQHNVIGVVTREDKPGGRGRRVRSTSVKRAAVDEGLEVLQPIRTDAPEFLQRVQSLSPDVSVVVAYGKILKEKTLWVPRHGSICLHPSLLPRYRGASPVQRAILSGEMETGITIFQMDEGMDSGDILIQKKTRIREGERAGELTERLSLLSGEILLQLLRLIESGGVQPEPQDDRYVTFAPKIEVEEARVDWNKDPHVLELESRAFDPWPGSFTFLGRERLRLFGIKEVLAYRETGSTPGEIVAIEEDGPIVRAGNGFVKVTEFQSSGKKRMDAAPWMRGRRLEKGAIFGP